MQRQTENDKRWVTCYFVSYIFKFLATAVKRWFYFPLARFQSENTPTCRLNWQSRANVSIASSFKFLFVYVHTAVLHA
jgi:hypothetical protein